MDADAYLRRMEYDGPLVPTLRTLRALHLAHLRAVPFENLDIGLGPPISLDPAAMFQKIVERWRGGYCYELNGLFALLLRELGFVVDMFSARVANDHGEYGPELAHMCLRIRLREDWLGDVGFGELFLRPLQLSGREVQPDDGKAFRLTEDGDRRVLWMRREEGTWKEQYAFALISRELEEFDAMNQWTQTSPESHFTQNSICTRVTPKGRITLSGLRLIVTAGRSRQEKILTDDERTSVLKESFGIVL